MSLSTQKPTTMHLQSENVAATAMMQSTNLDAVPQRVREIAMLRGLGYSFRQIAEQFSVTPQAVSLMLSRHRRCLKALRGSVELNTLSPRAVNALGRHGIRTREQARKAGAIDLLRGERNCGRKTLEEVAHWMDGAVGQS
jgi:DNA-binding NarL/FixJ family response regulator